MEAKKIAKLYKELNTVDKASLKLLVKMEKLVN